jgi:hypothetical protein
VANNQFFPSKLDLSAFLLFSIALKTICHGEISSQLKLELPEGIINEKKTFPTMNSTRFLPMATATYYSSAFYFGLVGVIAIAINVSIILVYIKNKKV